MGLFGPVWRRVGTPDIDLVVGARPERALQLLLDEADRHHTQRCFGSEPAYLATIEGPSLVLQSAHKNSYGGRGPSAHALSLDFEDLGGRTRVRARFGMLQWSRSWRGYVLLFSALLVSFMSLSVIRGVVPGGRSDRWRPAVLVIVVVAAWAAFAVLDVRQSREEKFELLGLLRSVFEPLVVLDREPTGSKEG